MLRQASRLAARWARRRVRAPYVRKTHAPAPRWTASCIHTPYAGHWRGLSTTSLERKWADRDTTAPSLVDADPDSGGGGELAATLQSLGLRSEFGEALRGMGATAPTPIQYSAWRELTSPLQRESKQTQPKRVPQKKTNKPSKKHKKHRYKPPKQPQQQQQPSHSAHAASIWEKLCLRNVGIASPTGTGKTLSYLLPLFELLKRQEERPAPDFYVSKQSAPRVLVISPHRHLSEQIGGVCKQLSHHVRLRTATVTGGMPRNKLHKLLRQPVDVVVGTPGMLSRLLTIPKGVRKSRQPPLLLSEVQWIVFDEADLLFDPTQGYTHDLHALCRKFVRKHRELGDIAEQTRAIGGEGKSRGSIACEDTAGMVFVGATFAPKFSSWIDSVMDPHYMDRLEEAKLNPHITSESQLRHAAAHLPVPASAWGFPLKMLSQEGLHQPVSGLVQRFIELEGRDRIMVLTDTLHALSDEFARYGRTRGGMLEAVSMQEAQEHRRRESTASESSGPLGQGLSVTRRSAAQPVLDTTQESPSDAWVLSKVNYLRYRTRSVRPAGDGDITKEEARSISEEEQADILLGDYLHNVSLFHKRSLPQTLIFCNTSGSCEAVAYSLEESGFSVLPFNSHMSHEKMADALKAFDKGECDILVATDMAARGMDFRRVQCVINFDMPSVHEMEIYLHRIGRTARAGRKGLVLNLCSKRDQQIAGTVKARHRKNSPLSRLYAQLTIQDNAEGVLKSEIRQNKMAGDGTSARRARDLMSKLKHPKMRAALGLQAKVPKSVEKPLPSHTTTRKVRQLEKQMYKESLRNKGKYKLRSWRTGEDMLKMRRHKLRRPNRRSRLTPKSPKFRTVLKPKKRPHGWVHPKKRQRKHPD